MLKEATLFVLALGVAGAFLKKPNDEPNLNFGSLLTRRLNSETVAKRVRSWKDGDSRNIWELSGLRQGDIIDSITGPRGAINDPKYIWPNKTVYYKLESGMSSMEVNSLIKVRDAIQNRTCVRFVRATPRNQDYIYIMHSADGCYSYIGRVGGAQPVGLARDSGCMQFGPIAHQLLHVVGLYHQHSVYNRDDYIYVNFTNIQEEHMYNFEIEPKEHYDDFGIEYDYHSIMHFSRFAFSKFDPIDERWESDKYSIVPYDENADIGQRHYISDSDFLKVNLHYKCPGYESGYVQNGGGNNNGGSSNGNSGGGANSEPSTGNSGGGKGSMFPFNFLGTEPLKAPI